MPVSKPKIVSIDLWGTLIKGSPEFNKAKLGLVRKYFGNNQSGEFILECFEYTKREWNNIIELTGHQPPTNSIYTLLFAKLNGGYKYYAAIVDEFVKDYQKLALDHPPQLYSTTTLSTLNKLSDIATLYLSSNTMFIQGQTLQSIIYTLGIGQMFTRLFFSDRMKVAKPDALMYGNSHYHIGDNPRTDLVGANTVGSKGILINSNNKTLIDAYNIIAQNG